MSTLETDPNGLTPHSAGAKLDAGKPDASLLLMFGRALVEVSAVGTFGARKYSRGGWQHVSDGANRYTAAMLRHLLAENEGPIDGESGLRHAAQVAWNALARLELILREEKKNHEQQGIVYAVDPTGVNPPVKISDVEFRRGERAGSTSGDLQGAAGSGAARQGGPYSHPVGSIYYDGRGL